MHPTQIKKLQAKVYGGTARGSVTYLNPSNINEVLSFFKEASWFLSTSDARLVEITMSNAEGKQVLRSMYKNKGTQTPDVEVVADEPEVWHSFNSF